MSRPRRAGLVGLLAASAVTTTGTRVSMVAVPWLVLVTTGSAAQAGVVAFAEMLPYVLMQALASPLVDRFGGRRVSVLCDAVSAPIVLAVPLLYDAGHLAFWHLCVVVAVLGTVRGPGGTAKTVLVPEVVDEAAVPMERGAGLLDGVERLGALLGAPLGGVLVATIGAANALFVDAFSFAVAAPLVLLFVRSRRAASTEPLAASPVRRYLHELREGLRFLLHDPLLRAIGVMVLATNLFDQAMFAVLLPVWAKTVIGSATAVGVIGGALGLGAVLGNASFSVFAHKLPRRVTYGLCFLVVGAPRYFLLAWSDSLVVIASWAVVSGFAAGAINPLLGAAEYERVPRRLQGRVLGAVGATAWLGIPFGGLVAGSLVAGLGLSWALVVFGLGYLAVTLLPFLQPAWRLMDRDKIHLQVPDAGEQDPSLVA